MKDFKLLLKQAKLRLLTMHFESNSGHLGGNLSCIDAIMVLHHLVMKPTDQFLLSKGHSAGALYITLWSLGKLSDSDLKSFSKDNSLLPGHPSGVSIPDLLFFDWVFGSQQFYQQKIKINYGDSRRFRTRFFKH